MAELFYTEIFILSTIVLNCIATPPGGTISVAVDFKVQLASIGTNIKFPCITDNTSFLTTLRYKQDSEISTMTRIAYYQNGKFRVTSDHFVGRILLQNSSTIVLNNVTVEDSGFYKCQIDFQDDGEDQNIINLKIGVAPKIQPLSVNEALEEMVLKVKCVAHGLPEPIMTWSYSDRDLGRDKQITSHLLELRNVKISQSGVYNCSAKNYMGQDLQSVEIKVYKKPQVMEFFLVGSLDGVVWQCENILLQCEAISETLLPILNYVLYHNNEEIIKQKSGKFILSDIGLQHTGVYSCVPETRLGQGWNKTLKLHVKASKLCKGSSTPSFSSLIQVTSTVKTASSNKTEEYIYNGSAAVKGLNMNFVLILLFPMSISVQN